MDQELLHIYDCRRCVCALARWQQFSAWNYFVAAVLKYCDVMSEIRQRHSLRI